MNKIVRDFMLAYNKVLSGIRYKSNGCIVFGEWLGQRANDNCLYLANYIQEHYPKYSLIWIANGTTDLSLLDDRIKRIEKDSIEGLSVVRGADVLIMNQGLSDFSDDEGFNISGPLKVNLWHGIAWKKIGIDSISDSDFLRNIEHKYQIQMKNADLYLASSEEFQEKMESAFLIKPDSFIHAGLPRNSIFYDINQLSIIRGKILKRLNRGNIKIIAYLPTFRDTNSTPFSFSQIEDLSFFSWLQSNHIYIIQKTHFAEIGNMKTGNSQILNINDISAQELMAASDMLITDYSSCFFDYLLLDRPIIHYLYDYDYYKNQDRGLYYSKEEVVCGAAPETIPDLIKAIKENLDNPSLYHDLRKKRKSKFLSYEDPDSCEIITKKIFEKVLRRRLGKECGV